MDYSDSTVIIPTLNEGRNIGKLIRILQGKYPKISIIVADDGSKDDTKAIVIDISRKPRSRVRFLDRKHAAVHGLTASVLDGLMAAGTGYAIVMDGDLQHPPEKVRQLVSALRKGADIAVGVRVSVEDEWPLYRRMISSTAASLGYARLLISGRASNDVLSGFFGIRTRYGRKLIKAHGNRFTREGYKVLFDFLKISPETARIAEIPYSFGTRRGGTSKINADTMLRYLHSLVK